MIEFRILNQTMPVTESKLSQQQKDIPELKITAPSYYLGEVSRPALFLEDCALLEDGVEIFTGIVGKIPNSPRIGATQFTCDGELGRLATEESVEVHFQHVPVSTAIATLLANAVDSTWGIDNTATLNDSYVTLDVRDKRNLWAQIRAVLDKCRHPTFIKFSHYDSGIYYVDLGYFGEENYDVTAIKGHNVLDAKSKPLATEPIKSISPISGKSGATNIPLSYAINAEPALATDADYPIIGNKVVNNTITRGLRIKKQMTMNKTRNIEYPNLTKKEQVALSMYGECLRDIQKSNPRTNAVVEVELDQLPQINDLIWVDVTVDERIYNDVIHAEETVRTFDLTSWVRVVGITRDFKLRSSKVNDINRTNTFIATLNVSTSDEVENFDDNKYLIDALEDPGKRDKDVSLSAIQVTDVVVNHSGASPDCSKGWGDGKLFEFTMPSVPGGANSVLTTVDVPTNRAYVVTQEAALPSTKLIICVSGEQNADWDTGDDLTVTATFVFI